MPRGKALTTRMRELAEGLTPEQMRKIAELLTQEAEKPRIDNKQYAKLQRGVKKAASKLNAAEEELSVFLANTGQPNDAISAEISDLRREGARMKPATRRPRKAA